jgi:conjugative relaxase-like TrwC/TraI family protein
MFSAGKMSGSAGEAARYYTRGDYYGKDAAEAGIWGGAGAGQLKLEGQVDKKDLQQVLDGNLGPHERVGWAGKKPEGERTTGFDFTFSPPKSVSIAALVAGDKRIIELQKEANAAGMAYIERHAAVRERTAAKGIETKVTGNLVYGSFTEKTSRELDPQLHTHNPIANATYDNDRDGWYAVNWKETMKSLKAADKVALAHMAIGLQKLGYALEVDQAKGSFEIKGFDENLLKGMSKANTMVEAWKETKPNVGWDEIRSFYKVNRSDKQKGSERDLEAKWRDEVRVGYDLGDWTNSPQELDRMRDAAIARPIEIDPSEVRRSLTFAIKKHIGREAVVPERQIIETALSHGMGLIDRPSLEQEIERRVEKGDILRPKGRTGEGPLLYPMTTADMHKIEKSFITELGRGRGKVSQILTGKEADKSLDAFRIESDGKSFPLTDEQKSAAKKVLTTKDRFTVIQGTAGAGKSEMVAAIMAAAPKRKHLGVAPTGQALKELEAKTGIRTMTVQRLVLTGAREISRGTIVYADEASMNDARIASKMARLARQGGFRLVTIGDRDQLPAIGAGRPHEESLETAGTIARLDKSMRQREGSQAALVAATVKAGQEWQRAGMQAPELRSGPRGKNPFGYLKTVLGDGLKEFSGEDPAKNRERIAKAAAKAFVEDRSGKRGPVLVLDNELRRTINKEVRQLRIERGELKGDRGVSATILSPVRRDEADRGENFTYAKGDILVFNSAAKTYGIEKGERFKLTGKTAKGSLELESLDKKNRFKTINAKKGAASSISVFRPEKRSIEVGDQITTTAKMGELANASSGEVTKISGKKVTFEQQGGKSVTIDLDRDQNWDHAYAMTFQKAQGATMETARVVLLSSDAQLASSRTLNSAVTRAKEDVELYTDNAADAIKKIAGRAGAKTSAMEAMKGQEKDIETGRKWGLDLTPVTDSVRTAKKMFARGGKELHADLPNWGMRNVDGERYELDDRQKEIRQKEQEALKEKGASEPATEFTGNAAEYIKNHIMGLYRGLEKSNELER